MASTGKDPNGRKRILFVDADGSRKTIRLGKASQKQADAFKVKLESLIAGKFTGSLDDETSRWIAALPDDMHSKLAAVGLVTPRAPTVNFTLSQFLSEYLKERTDIKPQTAVVLGHTRRNLIAFFGADRALSNVTEGDADAWRLYLIGQGLSDATVCRRCGVAKQFFRSAVRHKLIPSNPFTDLKSCVKANRKRQRFISRPDAQRILNACPDSQWRLIFALARFGGLRTPSEIMRLRWADVDWENNRITVHSPKTEHHAGHESRQIPLFGELRPHLMQVFEEAEPGTEAIITRYRLDNMNLRTQFGRILTKAGLQVWPKPFQNLRSTRETELCEQFPEHVVCAWIGNSKLVAREHYLQVRDEDFERAASGPQSAAQNPAQYAAVPGGNDLTPTPQEAPEDAGLLLSTTASKSLQNREVGRVGFEPTQAYANGFTAHPL